MAAGLGEDTSTLLLVLVGSGPIILPVGTSQSFLGFCPIAVVCLLAVIAQLIYAH